MNEVNEGQRIQSVDRAVALLRAVSTMAPGEATLSALAQRCRINRSTAWRLLSTLQHHHYVERDHVTNSYSIGFAAFHLGGTGADSLVSRARPILHILSAGTGETASLAAPRGLALVYVDQIALPNASTADWLGRQVALHATSGGKAYLAWLPRDELALVLPSRLERYTSTTLITESALRSELARTRERGFGVGLGELESMVWGVAAPVVSPSGRPVAVVSLWGSTGRMRQERFASLGRLVVEAAEDVATELELR